VEAAIALAALVLVVVLGIGAVLAASMNLRCIDAAREAARLAARGDSDRAAQAAHRVAPRGAQVRVSADGDYVVVRISVAAPLFPLLTISADAVAAREPGDG
jgi:hypothetical protein